MAFSGDVDRISALPDDLLHLILTFVCEAKAVTRTAALSRRWRRVWIHAQHLALSDPRLQRSTSTEPDGKFACFVDWVLAQRGDADIGSLDILTRVAQLPSPEQVNRWLRYAARHVVKSLRLHLPYDGYSSPSAAAAVIALPDQGRMTSMTVLMSRLSWRLQLPAAADARYEALTDLSLSCMTFVSGAGRTLGDFVSSCCPRLRKLGISGSNGLTQLAFRSETLQNLKLFNVGGLRVLDVTAPNLLVLKLIEFCSLGDWISSDDDVGEVVRIAAPRLQEIGIDPSSFPRRSDLDIHDLTGVRRLNHLRLNMHGQYCALAATDIGFWLLANCPSAEDVSDLWLEHNCVSVTEGIEVVDLTSEGASPFANVRSMDMSVLAHQFPKGHLVPSVFALLLRCPRLRSLHIHIAHGYGSSWCRLGCLCNELLPWTDHREISLESLEEVRISGFKEADDDVDLVSLLFASSDSIRSMSLSLSPDDRKGTVDQKLMSIPKADRGRWHFGDSVYTWTRNAAEITTPVHSDAMSSKSV